MIIVGVDYSAGSAAAASVALRLAVSNRTPWRLLHVRSAAGLETEREDLREDWVRGLGLVKSDVEVRRGVPWIEIVRAAGESGASLVVAGTHGRSGFQPLRLGQTAELVALRSPAPVLLVPPTHVSAHAVTYSEATIS